MDKAIDLCVKNKNQRMITELMDHLDRDYTGNEKDKYILKLYIASGDYRKASSVALQLSTYEQTEGNYKIAHDILLGLIKDMRREKHYVIIKIIVVSNRTLYISTIYTQLSISKETSISK